MLKDSFFFFLMREIGVCLNNRKMGPVERERLDTQERDWINYR